LVQQPLLSFLTKHITLSKRQFRFVSQQGETKQ